MVNNSTNKSATRNRKRPDIDYNAETIAERPPLKENLRDAQALDQDLDESYREPALESMDGQSDNSNNWSREYDRGESLAEHKDPYSQEPEMSSEIPPELVQKRAYELYLARGYEHGQNLADWFEAERQVRNELKFHK